MHFLAFRNGTKKHVNKNITPQPVMEVVQRTQFDEQITCINMTVKGKRGSNRAFVDTNKTKSPTCI